MWFVTIRASALVWMTRRDIHRCSTASCGSLVLEPSVPRRHGMADLGVLGRDVELGHRFGGTDQTRSGDRPIPDKKIEIRRVRGTCAGMAVQAILVARASQHPIRAGCVVILVAGKARVLTECSVG